MPLEAAGVDVPEAAVIGSCASPDVGTRNQT